MMKQLSGGQKTVVAVGLIFAIQRCDPMAGRCSFTQASPRIDQPRPVPPLDAEMMNRFQTVHST